MRFATFCSAATALIAATPGVVYAAESGYEGGKPFILKSNPRQQKDTADFENKYGTLLSSNLTVTLKWLLP